MPWKWRERPGVGFVELFVDGKIREPNREKLDPEGLRWLDEVALPELRAEWAEHLRAEQLHDDEMRRHYRNAATNTFGMLGELD